MNKANEIKKLHDRLKTGDRNIWLQRAKEAFRFAIGEQLTEAEKNALEDKLMPTFVINRITPQLELMRYFCTANTPRWRAVGVDGTDSKLGEVHQAIASHVWYISDGNNKFSQVMWDALTKSIGWFQVKVDPNMDNGLGEVVIDTVEPFEMFVDPRSRDPLMRDASFILVAKQFSVSQMVNMFPQKKKEIWQTVGIDGNEDTGLDLFFPYMQGDLQDDAVAKDGSQEQMVTFYEFYEKRMEKHYNVIMDSDPASESILPKNYILSAKEFNKIMKDEELSQLVLNYAEFYKPQIYRTQSAGSELILSKDVKLPGSYFPFVAVPYRHTGTPYPSSASMDLVGKQQEINKAHQIMIHHANLSSAGKWLAEEGTIDEEKWEQNASVPGAILTYRTAEKPPQQVSPLPLNNAFYNVVDMGKTDMEYISGMHTSMMGFTQSDREPYRGLLAKDEFGTRRVKSYLQTIVEPALTHLANLIDAYAKEFYEVEKVIRMVDPEDAEEWKEITLNEVGDSTPEVQKYFTDLREGTFDIRIVPGSTQPVNRWARLDMMERWREMGIVDDIAVIMESDIPKKKELLQRKSLYKNMESMISSMEAGLKQKDDTINTLSRQLVQAGIKMEVNDAEKDIEKKKYALILEIYKLMEEAKSQGKEVNRELESVLHRLETELEYEAKAEKDKINSNNNQNQSQE